MFAFLQGQVWACHSSNCQGRFAEGLEMSSGVVFFLVIAVVIFCFIVRSKLGEVIQD
jgi:hypothetical protein